MSKPINVFHDTKKINTYYLVASINNHKTTLTCMQLSHKSINQSPSINHHLSTTIYHHPSITINKLSVINHHLSSLSSDNRSRLPTFTFIDQIKLLGLPSDNRPMSLTFISVDRHRFRTLDLTSERCLCELRIPSVIKK